MPMPAAATRTIVVSPGQRRASTASRNSRDAGMAVACANGHKAKAAAISKP